MKDDDEEGHGNETSNGKGVSSGLFGALDLDMDTFKDLDHVRMVDAIELICRIFFTSMTYVVNDTTTSPTYYRDPNLFLGF